MPEPDEIIYRVLARLDGSHRTPELVLRNTSKAIIQVLKSYGWALQKETP